MKKSNVFMMALAVVASALLLGLWFILGFNQVDQPLDLIVSIVWWVLVGAVVLFVRQAEKRRCQALRTCYIGAGVVFNQESGVVAMATDTSTIDTIENVVSGLEYGFDKIELPEDLRGTISWIVRTEEFEDEGEVWSGEVVRAGHPDMEPIAFDSRTALAWALLGNGRLEEGLVPEQDLPQEVDWHTI